MIHSQLAWLCVVFTLATLVMPTLSIICAFCKYDRSSGHGVYEYQCVNDTSNYNQTRYSNCYEGCKTKVDYDSDYKTILFIQRECGSGYFFGSYCDPPGRSKHYCVFTCFQDRCNDDPYNKRAEETTTTTTTTAATSTNSAMQGSDNHGGKTHPFGVPMYILLQLVMYTLNQASYT